MHTFSQRHLDLRKIYILLLMVILLLSPDRSQNWTVCALCCIALWWVYRGSQVVCSISLDSLSEGLESDLPTIVGVDHFRHSNSKHLLRQNWTTHLAPTSQMAINLVNLVKWSTTRRSTHDLASILDISLKSQCRASEKACPWRPQNLFPPASYNLPFIALEL